MIKVFNKVIKEWGNLSTLSKFITIPFIPLVAIGLLFAWWGVDKELNFWTEQ